MNKDLELALKRAGSQSTGSHVAGIIHASYNDAADLNQTTYETDHTTKQKFLNTFRILKLRSCRKKCTCKKRAEKYAREKCGRKRMRAQKMHM